MPVQPIKTILVVLSLALFIIPTEAVRLPYSARLHRRFTYVAQPAPEGWATDSLEDYQQYHFRYLALGCHTRKGDTFFDKCCHPRMKDASLKNIPAECALEPESMVKALYIMKASSSSVNLTDGENGNPVFIPNGTIRTVASEKGCNDTDVLSASQIRVLTQLQEHLSNYSNSSYFANMTHQSKYNSSAIDYTNLTTLLYSNYSTYDNLTQLLLANLTQLSNASLLCQASSFNQTQNTTHVGSSIKLQLTQENSTDIQASSDTRSAAKKSTSDAQAQADAQAKADAKSTADAQAKADAKTTADAKSATDVKAADANSAADEKASAASQAAAAPTSTSDAQAAAIYTPTADAQTASAYTPTAAAQTAAAYTPTAAAQATPTPTPTADAQPAVTPTPTASAQAAATAVAKTDTASSFTSNAVGSVLTGVANVIGTDGSAKGTYFFQEGGTGACGNVNADSTALVALPTALYANGAHCGKNVLVMNTANGKSVNAKVQDMCPGCPSSTSLDLSTGAYDAIGARDTGVLPIQWGFTD